MKFIKLYNLLLNSNSKYLLLIHAVYYANWPAWLFQFLNNINARTTNEIHYIIKIVIEIMKFIREYIQIYIRIIYVLSK
jgi:hypothetical protein